MAFKTFVDAVTLPASDLNTYLMKQSVIVCTSGTRPSSPNEGMAIYETDTDKLLIYTTATTTWKPPWNLPWGYQGHGTATANQTGMTATTDLTGLSVTFTAVANRRYRAMLQGSVDSSVNNDVVAMNIYQGASPIAYGQVRVVIAGQIESLSLFAYFTASSGSVTVKGTAGRASGSGTEALVASATNPAWFIVEDIGPSGAPA